MKTTFNLKSIINGMTVSTVKLGKAYETMVFDQFGNEVQVLTATYKVEAEHNHRNCVGRFAVRRNCIHAI